MSFNHKHKSSEAADSAEYSLFEQPLSNIERQESASLISPTVPSSTTTIMRKTPSKSLDDVGSIEQMHAIASSSGISGTDTQPEATFHVRGTRVRACLTRTGMQLTALQGPLVPCIGRAVLGLLPYSEMLAATAEARALSTASSCCGNKYLLVIHTIRRSLRNKCIWHTRAIKLATNDAEIIKTWSAKVNATLKQNSHRPRNLLVVINPYGGARQALKIWQKHGSPIFDRAGIKYDVIVTEREGHAREIVQQLSTADLQTVDGIVAVGGDGLFQEILNGMLEARGRRIAEMDGGKRLRLGHIPAGSTDAVAFSINGTRSQTTAALHIALGDRTPLDVLRVDTGDGQHRFAVCVASYGYMGDLMRLSEKLRWMGPARYNTAGTLALLRGRAYRAKISYRPVVSDRFSLDTRLVCRSQCDLCKVDSGQGIPDPAAFTRPATDALQHGVWKTVEGEFMGIMAVVTPCRSDRSTLGLVPYGHLNDGRLHLVLVKKCSVLQYLRFLVSIPIKGVEPGAFPYVEVIDVTAVQVTPEGPQSSWNVDGELLAHNGFTGQVHRGLLEVFARGVE